jgi:hypothetical protein
MKEEIQAEKDFEEIWKPLLMTDNKLDMKKVKNEMIDLIFVYRQVGKVYQHLTGNLLSKPMYYAETIIQKHDEIVQEAYEEGLEEGERETSN